MIEKFDDEVYELVRDLTPQAAEANFGKAHRFMSSEPDEFYCGRCAWAQDREGDPPPYEYVGTTPHELYCHDCGAILPLPYQKRGVLSALANFEAYGVQDTCEDAFLFVHLANEADYGSFKDIDVEERLREVALKTLFRRAYGRDPVAGDLPMFERDRKVARGEATEEEELDRAIEEFDRSYRRARMGYEDER